MILLLSLYWFVVFTYSDARSCFIHQRPPTPHLVIVASLIQTDLSTQLIGMARTSCNQANMRNPGPKPTWWNPWGSPATPPHCHGLSRVRSDNYVHCHNVAQPPSLSGWAQRVPETTRGSAGPFSPNSGRQGAFGRIQTLAPSCLLVTSLYAPTPETQVTAQKTV